tara:strand:+ start:88 stop:549 length:462 start_codon:yes stop_codon:yes gene_type:complete
MANLEEAFNAKFDSENIKKINNHNDVIDHFFTQRKVTEFEEFIDKNMNRKKKKKDITYNFIAVNIPHFSYSEADDINIDLKIWGDEGFKYIGKMTNLEGFSPSLLLKLGTDKQIFVKIIIRTKKGDEELEKEFVSFISIPKRYQLEPNSNIDV